MTSRITGIGAITSLGDSWRTTVEGLESLEMGLVRDSKVIGVDGLPMTLAPVWPLHDIHNPLKRLVRLATAALHDLVGQGYGVAQSSGVTVLLPAWVRQGRHDDPIRDRLSERWSMPTDLIAIAFVDQTTLFDLVVLAQQRAMTQVLIVVETYLHAELLDSLTASDRILSRYQPHGLVPSEAGIAFLLEPASGLAASCAVATLRRARDPVNLRQPDTILGLTLAQLVGEVLDTGGQPQRLLSDLNGERWRSEELAVVASRWSDRLPEDALADIESPASQTGYSGAAMAGVLLGLACRPGSDAAQSAGVNQDSLILFSQFDGTRVAARVTGTGIVSP